MTTWTDHMAHRITARVRRTARLSWAVALGTVLGAGGLVLTPRPVEGPELVEIVPAQEARSRSAGPRRVGGPGPVQVRLDARASVEADPVDIRF